MALAGTVMLDGFDGCAVSDVFFEASFPDVDHGAQFGFDGRQFVEQEGVVFGALFGAKEQPGQIGDLVVMESVRFLLPLLEGAQDAGSAFCAAVDGGVELADFAACAVTEGDEGASGGLFDAVGAYDAFSGEDVPGDDAGEVALWWRSFGELEYISVRDGDAWQEHVFELVVAFLFDACGVVGEALVLELARELDDLGAGVGDGEGSVGELMQAQGG